MTDPRTHGRHAAPRHRHRAPLLAALAVLVLVIGGWALLGRGTGAPAEASGGLFPTTVVRTTAVRTTAAPSTTVRTTAAPSTAAPSTRATTPAAGTTAATGSPTAAAYAGEVTRLTNLERAKAGCSAVRVEPKLQTAAQLHSKDMVDRNYFSHTSPDGRGPGDRAAAQGYTTWSGENIAAGYPTPAAVVQGWMNSPGHKANILNCRSRSTGVGFDARQNMWTQMFGFV